MTPLNVIHPDLLNFGSEKRPLRPSKLARLLGCQVNLILDMRDESTGGKAAQTGNLVHSAAHVYHTTQGPEADRVTAALAALEAAREKFPEGDAEKAVTIIKAYVGDPKNREAEVVWCEAPIRLTLAPDKGDPTGAPIVIAGTLDQVRRGRDGILSVWDIKTGEAKTAFENVLEYQIQQAVYVLGARATLNPEIQPGGLVFTPSYGRIKASAHLPMGLTIEDCEALMTLVPAIVSSTRQGKPGFRPSVENCKWCSYGPWPKCRRTYKGVYG